jgi:beta-glucosidase/6-phospho-beta-glucosidase/beta-galactosidase
MVKVFEQKSVQEGTWSRLPVINEELKKKIKGTAEFLGVNYYTSRLVAPRLAPDSSPQLDHDIGMSFTVDENWTKAKTDWLYIVPEGIHDLLVWIKDNYDNPKVMITENGFTDNGEINDVGRVRYLKEHLAAVLRAKKENCNIVGYTVWSLIDNFEWNDGYTTYLGIFSVDMNSATKERSPKRSARFFRDVIANRKFEMC